jgi:hypothetical protein
MPSALLKLCTLSLSADTTSDLEVGTRHSRWCAAQSSALCALSFVAQYIDIVERSPDDEQRVVVRD